PVLTTLKIIKEEGVWFESTNLAYLTPKSLGFSGLILWYA
ncbi:hypothetical protein HKBW3S09_01662, partial [Candidatus Hakubella thermalkaliphila]